MQYHLSQTPIIFSPIKIGHKNFHEGLDIRKKQDQLKCEYSVYVVSSSFQEMLWISIYSRWTLNATVYNLWFELLS